MFYDQKCFLLIGISVKHDFFLSEAVNDSISCCFQPNPTQNWFWADLASSNSPLKYELDCHEILESTKTGFLIGSTIAISMFSEIVQMMHHRFKSLAVRIVCIVFFSNLYTKGTSGNPASRVFSSNFNGS